LKHYVELNSANIKKSCQWIQWGCYYSLSVKYNSAVNLSEQGLTQFQSIEHLRVELTYELIAQIFSRPISTNVLWKNQEIHWKLMLFMLINKFGSKISKSHDLEFSLTWANNHLQKNDHLPTTILGPIFNVCSKTAPLNSDHLSTTSTILVSRVWSQVWL